MRYDYIVGCAYPLDFDYKELPNTLVEVSEEDHLRIANRKANESFKIEKDGSIKIFVKGN